MKYDRYLFEIFESITWSVKHPVILRWQQPIMVLVTNVDEENVLRILIWFRCLSFQLSLFLSHSITCCCSMLNFHSISIRKKKNNHYTMCGAQGDHIMWKIEIVSFMRTMSFWNDWSFPPVRQNMWLVFFLLLKNQIKMKINF